MQHSQYSKIPTPPSDFLRHEALKRLTSIKQQQGLGARARSLISCAGKPRISLRVMAVWGSPCKPERGSSCFRHVGVVLQRAEDTLNRAEVSQPPSCCCCSSIHPSICLPIRPHTAPGRVQHLQHNSFPGSTATHLPPWPTVDGGETHQVMRLLQPAHPAAPKTARSPVRSRRTFPVIYNNPWECPVQTWV